MGTGRTRQLSEQKADAIAKVQSRKNARLKARRARNARLREQGVKFSHKDACYKGE